MKYYRLIIALFAISLLFTNCGKETENIEEDSVIPEEPVLVEKQLLVNKKTFHNGEELIDEYIFEYDEFLRMKSLEKISHCNHTYSIYKEYEYNEQGLISETKTFNNNNKLRYHVVFTHNDLSIEVKRYLVDTLTQEKELCIKKIREYNDDGYLVRILTESHNISKDISLYEEKYFYDDMNNMVRNEYYKTINGVAVLRYIKKDIVYDDQISLSTDVYRGYGDRSYQVGNEVFSVKLIYDEGELVSEKEYIYNFEYDQNGYPLKKSYVFNQYIITQEFEYEIVEVEM